MKIRVLNGNCLDVLSELPEQSVNTCITSPPYYGLRDYQTAEWIGGDENCEHTISHYSDNLKPEVDRPFRGNRSACIKCGAIRKDSQLGLEETPEEYVENIVAVFGEVRKVLRDDGTVWLNLGDSYGTEKQLQGIPWRVAFALQADGWYLRQDIIWHKPNPMPESVKDRCTKAHEYIFLLSKNKKYYYDNDAIREPHTWEESKPRPSGMERNAQKYRSKVNYGGGGSGFAGHSGSLKADGTSLNHPDGRNKRSVWTVTTKPFKDAHFATFPPELIKPCILAGCPEDGTVLDPFGGSGTTGVVANRYGRNAILIELNDEYAEMSRNRIYNDSPLFVDVE